MGTTKTSQRRTEHIYVGVDGSLGSRAAVRWAVDHAHPGDTITLVHVWDRSSALAEDDLVRPDDDTAAHTFANHELGHAKALARSSEITLACAVQQGDVRASLCQLDADLLVVGARGLGGVTGLLLGSVSSYLARHSRHPLVIVPSPEAKPS